MSSPAFDLATIQAWMQSVIMNRAGVIDGIASVDARSHIDVSPAQIESVIERSSQQTSVERLEIYSGAYYARLLECLRAEYPIMAEAMGKELFDEFAVEYLQRHPSHSYTLNDLGGNFPKFLAETRPTSAMRITPGWISWSTWQNWSGASPKFSMVRAPRIKRLLGKDQLQGLSATVGPGHGSCQSHACESCGSIFRFRIITVAIRDGAEAVPPDREPTWLRFQGGILWFGTMR